MIVIGVTGSIAAYKAADLTSKLIQNGFKVQIIMTESATKFVHPQTFLTLSQNPVITNLWEVPSWQPEHISLAEKTKLFIIAPATANIIAKITHGIADDALSTFAISHTGPLIIIPAMNPRMWNNQATQDNLEILKKRNIIILEPNIGRVACGEEGKGRFPEVNSILEFIKSKMILIEKIPKKINYKLNILITAGPTQEAIDPVRFLTNKSSGKMGYSLANIAIALGFNVTLISGPVNLLPPINCNLINIQTALEMKEEVHKNFLNCDLLIMCAAVADYKSEIVFDQKVHKIDNLNLKLIKTDDILLSLKEKFINNNKFIVGFAAETENLKESAVSKMNKKGLNMIVGNNVSRKDIGFDTNDNEVIIFTSNGNIFEISKCSKIEISVEIFLKIFENLK